MWDLVGRNLQGRRRVFMRENGADRLAPHYRELRRIDLPATVDMTADEMRHYIANSVAHRHLADRVPDFDGTWTITASTAVFLATTS